MRDDLVLAVELRLRSLNILLLKLQPLLDLVELYQVPVVLFLGFPRLLLQSGAYLFAFLQLDLERGIEVDGLFKFGLANVELERLLADFILDFIDLLPRLVGLRLVHLQTTLHLVHLVRLGPHLVLPNQAVLIQDANLLCLLLYQVLILDDLLLLVVELQLEGLDLVLGVLHFGDCPFVLNVCLSLVGVHVVQFAFELESQLHLLLVILAVLNILLF